MITHDACPICAATAYDCLATRGTHGAPAIDVLRCRVCRFVYTRPAMTDTLPSAPERPNPFGGHGVAPDARARHRLDVIESLVPRGTLLEVGCREGGFLAAARQRGWVVAGVEPTAARQAAQAQLPGIPIAPALTEGRWPAGTFDAICLWDGLERATSPGELLYMTAHYCRIDGIVALEIPRRACHDDTQGACRYPLPTLERLLARIGFRLEWVEEQPGIHDARTLHGHGEAAVHRARLRRYTEHGTIASYTTSLLQTRRPPSNLFALARYVP